MEEQEKEFEEADNETDSITIKNNNEKISDSIEEVKLPDKLEKIQDEKIRGRIIIFNSEKSEIAKNLGIKNIGDYTEKAK